MYCITCTVLYITCTVLYITCTVLYITCTVSVLHDHYTISLIYPIHYTKLSFKIMDMYMYMSCTVHINPLFFYVCTIILLICM